MCRRVFASRRHAQAASQPAGRPASNRRATQISRSRPASARPKSLFLQRKSPPPPLGPLAFGPPGAKSVTKSRPLTRELDKRRARHRAPVIKLHSRRRAPVKRSSSSARGGWPAHMCARACHCWGPAPTGAETIALLQVGGDKGRPWRATLRLAARAHLTTGATSAGQGGGASKIGPRRAQIKSRPTDRARRAHRPGWPAERGLPAHSRPLPANRPADPLVRR